MTASTANSSAIRAKKVLGKNVEDASGHKIGAIEDVVLDKNSNSIMFAVVRFGGFLGMGEKYHPLPWSGLVYDDEHESYVVRYTKEELEAAPAATIDELVVDNGARYRDRTYDYYRAPRYWDAR